MMFRDYEPECVPTLTQRVDSRDVVIFDRNSVKTQNSAYLRKMWRCDGCLVDNDDDTTQCICCESKRTGFVEISDGSVTIPTAKPSAFNGLFDSGNSSTLPNIAFGVGNSNVSENKPSIPTFGTTISSSTPSIGPLDAQEATAPHELPQADVSLQPETPMFGICADSPGVSTIPSGSNRPLSGGRLTFGVASGIADPVLVQPLDPIETVQQLETPKDATVEIPSCRPMNNQRRPSATVFTWGSGECDQLAVGMDYRDESGCMPTPYEIKNLRKFDAAQIASGAMHTVAILSSGWIVSWGCNDDYVLGRPTGSDMGARPETYPAFATFIPEDEQYVQVACGDNHTALLTRSARVLAWGTYKDTSGHLGFPDVIQGFGTVESKRVKRPVEIPLPGCKASKLLCGENHTVVLCRTAEGKTVVALFGSNESGQLARQEQGVECLFPKMHSAESLGFPTGSVLYDIGSGKVSSFFFARIPGGAQQIRAVGRNFLGELGIGHVSKAVVCVPTEVVVQTGVVIKKVVGGQFFSMFLTAENKVLTCGHRELIGQGMAMAQQKETTGLVVPTEVAALAEYKIVDIGVGGDTAFAVADSGILFVWGEGQMHQLGMGTDLVDPLPEPTPIPASAFNDRAVITATGGSLHSVALVYSGAEGDPLPVPEVGVVEPEEPVSRKRRREESSEEEEVEEIRPQDKRARLSAEYEQQPEAVEPAVIGGSSSMEIEEVSTSGERTEVPSSESPAGQGDVPLETISSSESSPAEDSTIRESEEEERTAVVIEASEESSPSLLPAEEASSFEEVVYAAESSPELAESNVAVHDSSTEYQKLESELSEKETEIIEDVGEEMDFEKTIETYEQYEVQSPEIGEVARSTLDLVAEAREKQEAAEKVEISESKMEAKKEEPLAGSQDYVELIKETGSESIASVEEEPSEDVVMIDQSKKEEESYQGELSRARKVEMMEEEVEVPSLPKRGPVAEIEAEAVERYEGVETESAIQTDQEIETEAEVEAEADVEAQAEAEAEPEVEVQEQPRRRTRKTPVVATEKKVERKPSERKTRTRKVVSIEKEEAATDDEEKTKKAEGAVGTRTRKGSKADGISKTTPKAKAKAKPKPEAKATTKLAKAAGSQVPKSKSKSQPKAKTRVRSGSKDELKTETKSKAKVKAKGKSTSRRKGSADSASKATSKKSRTRSSSASASEAEVRPTKAKGAAPKLKGKAKSRR